MLDFLKGEKCKDSILIMYFAKFKYYLCEEFDNYWGSSAQSKRVAMMIFDWPRNMYAKFFGKTTELFAKVTGRSKIA